MDDLGTVISRNHIIHNYSEPKGSIWFYWQYFKKSKS